MSQWKGPSHEKEMGVGILGRGDLIEDLEWKTVLSFWATERKSVRLKWGWCLLKSGGFLSLVINLDFFLMWNGKLPKYFDMLPEMMGEMFE